VGGSYFNAGPADCGFQVRLPLLIVPTAQRKRRSGELSADILLVLRLRIFFFPPPLTRVHWRPRRAHPSGSGDSPNVDQTPVRRVSFSQVPSLMEYGRRIIPSNPPERSILRIAA